MIFSILLTGEIKANIVRFYFRNSACILQDEALHLTEDAKIISLSAGNYRYDCTGKVYLRVSYTRGEMRVRNEDTKWKNGY